VHVTYISVRRPWTFANELKPLGGAFLTLALCLPAAVLGAETGPGGREAGPVGEQARTLAAIAWLLLRIALVLGGLFFLPIDSGLRCGSRHRLMGPLTGP
jgi:hypothetical protein